MEKIIIGDITPYESRFAILEENVVTQLFYERSLDLKIVGNIYLGRVTNVLPGMQSAFVDIGTGKDVFLQIGDMDIETPEGQKARPQKIQNLVKAGDLIPTQIIKDAIQQKGARASTCVAFPGRYCVLVPSMKHVGISRKITSEKERQRLLAISKEILPEGMGLIMRTVSDSMTSQALRSDIEFLLKSYNDYLDRLDKAKEIGPLHEELPVYMKIVRDYFTDDVTRFIINSKHEYDSILEHCDFLTPFQFASLEYYDGDKNIFEQFNVEKEVNASLSPKVWLPSGGYLFIQSTEALVAIDVNSGKYTGTNSNLSNTVYQANLSSIKEIARQIRLRNMAGIIIIDFIDMQNESHKRDIVRKLRLEFDKDPVKTQIFDLTDLGLVQMTRHRTAKGMHRILLEDCPYCEGKGAVYNRETTTCKVLGNLSRLLEKKRCRHVKVELHPTVAEFIKANYQDILRDYNSRFKTKIRIDAVAKLHFNDYHIISTK